MDGKDHFGEVSDEKTYYWMMEKVIVVIVANNLTELCLCCSAL